MAYLVRALHMLGFWSSVRTSVRYWKVLERGKRATTQELLAQFVVINLSTEKSELAKTAFT